MRNLSFLLMSLMTLGASSQILIKPNAQVVIGEEPASINIPLPHERDTVTTLNVYGLLGDMGEGASIGFGDNVSIYAKNVVVGELGNTDTDKLWLHGKHGVYITHDYAATDTLFYYDDSRGNYAQFNCDVKCSGVFVASDERFKSNINPISDSEDMLYRLNPIQYNLKDRHNPMPALKNGMGGSNDKLSRDISFYSDFYNQNRDDRLHFGLLAQEVEKIFPNLVVTDPDGYKHVDYIGLIPILINAVNDLNTRLSSLQNEDSYLHRDGLSDDTAVRRMAAPDLMNSSCGINEINCEIPYDCSNARISFYDMTGKFIKDMDVPAGIGSPKIVLESSVLNDGLYICVLTADNKEISTSKVMVRRN